MKQFYGEKFLFLIFAILNGSILCDKVFEEDIANWKSSETLTDANLSLNSLVKYSYNDNVENKTHFRKRHWGHTNFIITDFLSDGEMERRLSLNGITAKETSLGNNR